MIICEMITYDYLWNGLIMFICEMVKYVYLWNGQICLSVKWSQDSY